MRFFDIRDRAAKFRPINIIIGGRGIGKTYSCLDFVINEDKPFIYLRNTDIQMLESSGAFGNPFKRLNLDKGYDFKLLRSGKHYIIKSGEELKGYGASLSTFSNLRGVDLSDVAYTVFDEFIELKKLSFDQYRAFLNFYETVNRNRELQGLPPLMVFLLSNSQTLNNPILQGFGLVETALQMMRSGQEDFTSKDLWLCLPRSEISEKKKDTALYRLSKGSKTFEEAINNKFAHDNFENIKKENINEYTPLCGFENIYVYRHKSTGKIFISQKPHDKRLFGGNDEKLLFMRSYGLALIQHKARNNIIYESYSARRAFEDLIS